MDALIKEFLNASYDETGDETENAIFKRLGELAAQDDDILLDMMDYFE